MVHNISTYFSSYFSKKRRMLKRSESQTLRISDNAPFPTKSRENPHLMNRRVHPALTPARLGLPRLMGSAPWAGPRVRTRTRTHAYAYAYARAH